MADNLARLLAHVLGEQRHHGVVVVLQGHNAQPDETPGRVAFAKTLHLPWCLARGENTLAEARWAISLATPDLTIVTSADHQLRAFLTFLQAAQDADPCHTVKLWNRSVFDRFSRSVDRRVDRLADELVEELEKIARYQRLGHVASFAQGMDYLDWRG